MGSANAGRSNERRVLLGACATALILPTIAVVSEPGAGLSVVVLLGAAAAGSVLVNLVARQFWAGVVFAGIVCMSPVLFIALFATANGGSIDILVLLPLSFVIGSIVGAIVSAVIRPARR